ncbi:hypothetical protein [Flavobacterium sp. XGLA_31]|uniref:hypothetical protein n=1 Tax=Flavobacterium sp. XGLA_31 TaxID=3447666 RepID=UPI003F3AF4EE
MGNNHSIVYGTVGGTFLSVLSNISSADLAKTALMAAIGAVVSFTISTVLKWFLKKHKK